MPDHEEYNQLKFDQWITTTNKKDLEFQVLIKDDEITMFGSFSCSLLRGFLLEERYYTSPIALHLSRL